MNNTHSLTYISTVLASVLSATVSLSAMAEGAPSKGNFDVGVAGGWGMTQTKETMIQTDDAGQPPSQYKFKLKGSGPVAGITGGYTLQHNKNSYGLMARIYKDFYSGRSDGFKKDNWYNIGISSKNDLKRKYTLELATKIGRLVTSDIELYGKLGVVRSQFREQFSDTVIDIRKNLAGWGAVVGLGAQKSYGSVKVGLEYSYQYYERMGTKMMYYNEANIKSASKFRPQYQNVLVTISNSF
jgi:hypothetical protein